MLHKCEVSIIIALIGGVSMTIGQRIKARRIELGLSVDFVAAKLNKNRATIYRYESDEIENLPTTVLEPLSEILQTTPAYLMGWGDDFTEKVIDHGSYKERVITDSNGKIVDVIQELTNMPKEKKEWVGTAFRAASELPGSDLEQLERYANLLLKEAQEKKRGK